MGRLLPNGTGPVAGIRGAFKPRDVAVDMHGFVYVADQGYDDFSGLVGAYPTHHILKFTSDGQFVEKWGRHGDGEDELSSVWAIAVDMNGFVYVCTGELLGWSTNQEVHRRRAICYHMECSLLGYNSRYQRVCLLC